MSNDENGVICTICLESLKKSNFNYPPYIPPVISLSCSHSYHFNCICSWFTKSCSVLCPVCKYPDNILLENFLPEIKNSLHNEILKSSREFLTDEEYEKYCENCIKQGNMLKMIEEEQRMRMNSQNGDDFNDEYYEDDCDDDHYPSPIAREHYYQNSCSPCPNRIATYNTELQYDTFNTERITEMDDIQEPLNDDNPFTYTRRGYLFDGIDEDDDEDEVITYARGVINCILDDEEKKEEECFERIRNKSKNKKRNTSKIDDDNKIHRRNGHSSTSKRPLDVFLRVLSREEEEEDTSISQNHEEYENILLNTNSKPSFIHKYRFYIISAILFIFGYLVFL